MSDSQGSDTPKQKGKGWLREHLGFKRRSRTPVPPQSERPSNESAAANEVVARPPSQDPSESSSGPPATVEEQPTLLPGLTQRGSLSQTAYQTAWDKLEEGEREKLKGDNELSSGFKKLSKADETSREKNLLRKGATTLQPWIKGLQGTLAFANPFLSLEPTATTASGIIGGVLSIAALLCGSMDWITGDIQAFLDVLPAVQRCEQAVVRHPDMDDVQSVLVDMYTDLFKFYIATHNMFDKSSSTLSVLIVKKSDLSGLTSSFKSSQGKLSMLINSVTFATVQAVQDDIADMLIQQVLKQDSDSDIKFLNNLNARSDMACSWIRDDSIFKKWFTTPKPEVLFLLGEMGIGKTTVSAYVRDIVSQQHVVCIHYFKDDEATTQPVNVYRTIILQVLRQRPDLKSKFQKWYHEAVRTCSNEPSRDEKKLGEFIVDTLSKSELWTFIILDGLDECEFRHAKSLIELFEGIIKGGAMLKLYIASRHNQNAEGFLAGLGPLTCRINFSPTAARDRTLTTHLLKQVSSSQHLFAKATDILAEKAEGSAIWLKLAIEYLQKCNPQSDFGLYEALEHLPASKDTSKMYGKLYTKIVSNMPDLPGLQSSDLEIALEILAVARRPLSCKELSVAICTNRSDRSAQSLADLEKRATAFGLIDYIHPFLMRIPEDEYSSAPGLRLVHHSLKELILQSPPSTWSSLQSSAGVTKDRPSRLESDMMARCISYLLYDECNAKEVDVNDVWSGWRSSIGPKVVSDAGLGIFFAYSATFWLRHFSDMHLDYPPKWEDVELLCDIRSPRSRNWASAFTRFDGYSTTKSLKTYWPSREKLDPLYITASAGCAVMLPSVIERKLGEDGFLSKIPWLLSILIERGSTDALGQTLKIEGCWPVLAHQMVYLNVLLRWCDDEEPPTPRALDLSLAFRKKVTEPNSQNPDRATQDHRALFIRQLIKTTMKHSPKVLLDWANELLCSSARRGNLTLLSCLLEAGREDSKIKLALQTPSRMLWVGRRVPLHQSIGEALMGPYPQAARLILQQGGFEAHVTHVSKSNTLHHTTFSIPETFVDDKLEVLLELLPDGMNKENNDGDTPFDVWLSSLSRFWKKYESVLLYESKDFTSKDFWERAIGSAKSLHAKGFRPKRWFEVHGCMDVTQEGAKEFCRFIHGEGSLHECIKVTQQQQEDLMKELILTRLPLDAESDGSEDFGGLV